MPRFNAPKLHAACHSDLSPLKDSMCHPVANGPAASSGILGPRPRPTSYLEAVLSHRQPQTMTTAPPKPLNNPRACFRCFASDHLVRDCRDRDPVRCRRCRGFGHRARSCTLLSHAISPRRKPSSIAAPASCHSVHDFPFAPRPTSPPPPSPGHHLAPTIAFDPLLMVPSPVFELTARAVKTCHASSSSSRPVDQHMADARGMAPPPSALPSPMASLASVVTLSSTSPCSRAPWYAALLACWN